MTTRILALLPALALPATEPVHEKTWPLPHWTRAAPSSVGLDETKLLEARQYAQTGGGAGIILRHGKLVLDWGDTQQRFDLKSTTKSFGAAALGLAIHDKLVRLDDHATRHHPTLGTPPDSNRDTGWIDQITLRHLAAQTAGFEKPGGYTKLLFPPGTQWDYSDSGPNWLAECLTLAYRRDLNDLMFERLFTPLGIRPADLVWRKNAYRPDLVDGIKRREFGSGISANVDAMARFGLLWLRGGEWNGKSLLPRDFVDQVRTTVPGVPDLPVRIPKDYGRAAQHYGLLWWNNADETIEGVPLDTYWTWGLYDSLIVVMPALDIVVARAGQSWKRSDGADHYDVLKPFLVPIAASARRGSDAPKTASRSATPYPPSPIIQAIDWAAPDRVIRLAPGSDNWPMTWASDDNLYTAYGDGRGFAPFITTKLSMGLAKVAGTPPEIQGINIPAPSAETAGDGARGRKASGMLALDGTLYMLVRNADNAQLGWSADHGSTWSWADWKWTTSFGCPTFLNYGQDYAGARDDFVYVYSHDSDSAYKRADRFVLARAPKTRLREQSAWEFFTAIDSAGRAMWSANIDDRGAVFSHPGACYRSSVSYNAPLGRYLWCQTGTGTDPRFAGGLAIYDAPEPWGPWTTAFYTEQWDMGPGESASLPTKWISHDGRTAHLVFSGEDHFSVRQATIRLRRPRLVVLTDIGGDPDDRQSLIRLLVHANEFDIEGLIASASGTPGELKREITQPQLIRETVEAYAQVRDNLARHADGFPTARTLMEQIKSGNPQRGRDAIGDGHDTEGSAWIMQCIERDDPRPLHITIWGGQTDLAQALWQLRRKHGTEQFPKLLARVRAFDIGDQDRIQDWIFSEFPDLFYVLAKAPEGADKRLGAYRGMYLGGDASLTSLEWLDTHVRTGHGPLGALYPSKTWTAPNPHSALKEGDTPSWFFLLPVGLGDPAHPEWGGWGGRYTRTQAGLFRDIGDSVDAESDPRAAVWRWRPAFQNEFAARMDWCVEYRLANHPPTAVLNGDASHAPITITAAPGDTVTLASTGSSDPDGHALVTSWFIYPDASRFATPQVLSSGSGESVRVTVPAELPGNALHVILQVTDSGTPPLTRYRRAIIQRASR